jgi:hypothetical protein
MLMSHQTALHAAPSPIFRNLQRPIVRFRPKPSQERPGPLEFPQKRFDVSRGLSTLATSGRISNGFYDL